jgi:hypothetical protein
MINKWNKKNYSNPITRNILTHNLYSTRKCGGACGTSMLMHITHASTHAIPHLHQPTVCCLLQNNVHLSIPKARPCYDYLSHNSADDNEGAVGGCADIAPGQATILIARYGQPSTHSSARCTPATSPVKTRQQTQATQSQMQVIMHHSSTKNNTVINNSDSMKGSTVGNT